MEMLLDFALVIGMYLETNKVLEYMHNYRLNMVANFNDFIITINSSYNLSIYISFNNLYSTYPKQRLSAR